MLLKKTNDEALFSLRLCVYSSVYIRATITLSLSLSLFPPDEKAIFNAKGDEKYSAETMHDKIERYNQCEMAESNEREADGEKEKNLPKICTDYRREFAYQNIKVISLTSNESDFHTEEMASEIFY